MRSSLGGNFLHLRRDKQLVERRADLARHDFGECDDFRRRHAEIGEEHAAGHALRPERRRGEARPGKERQDLRVEAPAALQRSARAPLTRSCDGRRIPDLRR